jgi:hypothetical protein
MKRIVHGLPSNDVRELGNRIIAVSESGTSAGTASDVLCVRFELGAPLPMLLNMQRSRQESQTALMPKLLGVTDNPHLDRNSTIWWADGPWQKENEELRELRNASGIARGTVQWQIAS